MTDFQKVKKDHTHKIGELLYKATCKKTNLRLCWVGKKAKRCRVGVPCPLLSVDTEHSGGMLKWEHASGL